MTYGWRLAEVDFIDDKDGYANETEDKRHEHRSRGPWILNASPCKPNHNRGRGPCDENIPTAKKANS